jgi:hypothetical protein
MKARITIGIVSTALAAVCLRLFVNLWGPVGPQTLMLQFAAISAVGFWGTIGGYTLWDCWDEKRRRDEEERRLRRCTRFRGIA